MNKREWKHAEKERNPHKQTHSIACQQQMPTNISFAGIADGESEREMQILVVARYRSLCTLYKRQNHMKF